MTPPSRRQRRLVLLLTLGLGALIFLWQLGSTGLVDETPPLFAASARAMAETGDWLIPRVNGLPRYDKPPLVYWLMGLIYALPGQERWNPLGTWAAALPSALASIGVMLALANTLLRWPQAGLGRPSGPTPGPAFEAASSVSALVTPLSAALAFALGPLVLLWGRVPVSDALFSGLLTGSLLLSWRRYADPGQPWWPAWPLLGLAVLTKGPVALLLLGLTLLLFGWLQRDPAGLVRRLRPLRGLLLSLLVALPWYGLALGREGRPFWESFFGYHNLQRFTSVVNHHLQPWWFFLPVLLIAALPATPLLLLGLARALGPLRLAAWPARPQPAPDSLARFAACWLLVVLAFFTLAATKLPSYWLPATPAAALLVALAVQAGPRAADGACAGHGDVVDAEAGAATAAAAGERTAIRSDHRIAQGGEGSRQRWAALVLGEPGSWADRWAWRLTLLLTALLAVVFLLAPLWVPWIQDPELPTLPAELLAGGRLVLAGWLWALAALLGWILALRRSALRLLALQLPLVLFVPVALLPSWGLGDRLRGLPVRQMAAAIRAAESGTSSRPAGALERGGDEALAMVGILKPSLHYYSRRLVLYEGIEPEGLVNLAERLRLERRVGQRPTSPDQAPTVLVVIDRTTAALPFWQGLEPMELGRAGLYQLWRLERRRLEARAAELRAAGHRPTWQRPRPERY
ncbi:MAG: glycosyltransferase family 39 protein [Cyanobium sp.]